MATNQSASEARTALAQSIVAKYAEAPEGFTPTDMQFAIEEGIKAIQDALSAKTDQLANILWSNEQRGHNGRLSELRRAAHELIDAADEALGKYRD